APLANVSFTTFLYDSPVQMMPSCDQTGVPIHFHSSTTSGSACLISWRMVPSVLPRQSASDAILAVIRFEAVWSLAAAVFFMASFPPAQGNNLDQVAARVVQHGDGRTGHLGRWHGELRAKRFHAIELPLHVVHVE